MNDPIFVEAARVFAERIVRQGGRSLDSRVDFAFRTALGRPPKAQEIAILRRLYHNQNARYAQDQRPIDPRCACSVCGRYSRAYVRHLFAAGELTAAILATHHNVHFYLDIMRRIREAIEFENLANFSAEMHARYAAGPA